MDVKETYTIKEVAELLSISNKTAYKLIKENRFAVVRIGRVIRVSKKSFDNWLNNVANTNHSD
ncbi:TPA: helix-turn-helix domain-containing protein [Enterococcus faecalis]|uniref:helix-turn-helix domain-containing protein n=1 Tax=Enterococcus TaxID=1350 RepID=UPI00100EF168|nr:helix-turn-helix domain-containing protein [Enterococcus faecalis]EHG5965502.1 helix-turn-helix domain-containing protein [Enterococcus faecalis]EHO3022548.1 helix-turn-helix domain-containing protein [Enterococcus faecalis]EHV2903648.1 helix-turn-helix domain-containing protein [Enterococcus faecalis]EJE4060846.1 helix-turn-helix domain-containing protein [Enterococcus faecalis]EKJ3561561.1 helix-turn-helix domain-containing protein [Enterococcus faecalis]